MILPADKGKAMVVMNRTDYDAKMLMMLKDESTYLPLEKDPTSALERRMNSTLMKLKRSGRLPDRVYICMPEKLSSENTSTVWAAEGT